MCYKKCECPHYLTNVASGNYNACGSCEYIIQMKKLQKRSRIALGIAFLVFIASTYIIF